MENLTKKVKFFKYEIEMFYILKYLQIVLFNIKNMLSWFFIVLADWNNSPRVDMSLHSNTLFWFRANQSLRYLLNSACLAQKQHIPIS
jgi:hypothetical protein